MNGSFDSKTAANDLAKAKPQIAKPQMAKYAKAPQSSANPKFTFRYFGCFVFGAQDPGKATDFIKKFLIHEIILSVILGAIGVPFLLNMFVDASYRSHAFPISVGMLAIVGVANIILSSLSFNLTQDGQSNKKELAKCSAIWFIIANIHRMVMTIIGLLAIIVLIIGVRGRKSNAKLLPVCVPLIFAIMMCVGQIVNGCQIPRAIEDTKKNEPNQLLNNSTYI